MSQTRAAIFASGSGSNFEAIMAVDDLSCQVMYLICDQPSAPVIAKANALGVETMVLNPKTFPTKADYEQAILTKLQKADVTWLFLAGYMRIVGETLLDAFPGTIINIHPSLLPDFPGIDAVGQALRAEATKTGVTVHYIDAGIDTGPIIAQKEVHILPEDTKEILTKRIQAVEHKLYPEVIKQLMTDIY